MDKELHQNATLRKCPHRALYRQYYTMLAKRYKILIITFIILLFILQFWSYINGKQITRMNEQILNLKGQIHSFQLSSPQKSLRDIIDNTANQSKMLQRAFQSKLNRLKSQMGNKITVLERQNTKLRQKIQNNKSNVDSKNTISNVTFTGQFSKLNQKIQSTIEKQDKLQKITKKIDKQYKQLTKNIDNLQKKTSQINQTLLKITNSKSDPQQNIQNNNQSQSPNPKNNIASHQLSKNMKNCQHDNIPLKIRKKIFYVQHDYNKLKKRGKKNHNKMVKQCDFVQLNQKNLIKYIKKWNKKPQNKQIQNDKLSQQEKRLLLIFLRLYYEGGQYFDPTQDIGKTQDRCVLHSNIGEQILFSSFLPINKDNLYIPSNSFTYLKADKPLSPMVKQVVQNIINKQKLFSMCQKRQCLVIPCTSK